MSLLSEESKQNTGCNGRPDDSGDIRCHGMGKKVVARIRFKADNLLYSSGIRHGGYSGITDKRIDFLAFRKEDVHEFHKQYSACRGNYE